MECEHKIYDGSKCSERIESILSDSDNSFEEISEIPSRSRLTYKNGFYVSCTAVFVDIRDSSNLPNTHNRPVLAKLYRSFISEVTSALAGDKNIAEISIVGDCVSGIFNGQYKSQVQETFDTVAKVSSAIKLLNYKFNKKGIKEVEVGIGMSYGRALMIQAGRKGTGVNDLVWMGDVVNEASNLSHAANVHKAWPIELMVSNSIYINLSQNQQNLLRFYEINNSYYNSIINLEMERWYNENCK